MTWQNASSGPTLWLMRTVQGQDHTMDCQGHLSEKVIHDFTISCKSERQLEKKKAEQVESFIFQPVITYALCSWEFDHSTSCAVLPTDSEGKSCHSWEIKSLSEIFKNHTFHTTNNVCSCSAGRAWHWQRRRFDFQETCKLTKIFSFISLEINIKATPHKVLLRLAGRYCNYTIWFQKADFVLFQCCPRLESLGVVAEWGGKWPSLH